MRPSSINTLRPTVTLVVVAALTVMMLPLRVQAFMPTQKATQWTNSEGSATHESITRDAIEEYDKDILFGLRARNKPLTQSMKDAIEEIINGNIAVDERGGPQYLKSSSHFDGESFQESQQRLIDYKMKVRDLVNPPAAVIRQGGKPDLASARYYLGQALHTLQDFYSHSNWIELGNTNPHLVLGKPGNPLTNPAATAATCTDCVRNSCTDCYNPNTGLTNLTGTTLAMNWSI
ncbi:MAG: HET-C-related protein [Pyrinomonadaceae bacterium]